MYKLEIEWNFKIYIDAENVEEAKDIFAEMSLEEVLEVGAKTVSMKIIQLRKPKYKKEVYPPFLLIYD